MFIITISAQILLISVFLILYFPQENNYNWSHKFATANLRDLKRRVKFLWEKLIEKNKEST